MLSKEELGHVAEFIGSVSIIMAAAITVWKRALLPLWRFANNTADIYNSLEYIKHELSPNGSGSIRDAVDRIEAKLIISEQRYKLLTMDSPFGVFETDARGDFLHVNRTYCRWAKCSNTDLEGKGWVNYLANAERQHVFQEWMAAVHQEREFTSNFSLTPAESPSFTVHCNAFPMFDGKDKLSGWIGIISKA